MEADQVSPSTVFSVLITLPARTYQLTTPDDRVELAANPAIGDLDITTSVPLTIQGSSGAAPVTE
jgi:hypothetical protein